MVNHWGQSRSEHYLPNGPAFRMHLFINKASIGDEDSPLLNQIK